MRHLLLALIIALLPLRAWVGDAMAVSMMGHTATSMVAAGAQPDCPDHAGEGPLALSLSAGHDLHGSTAEAQQPDHPPDHQHSACDVCNGPALVVGLLLSATVSQHHTLLALPAERFASVALQQGIKPPIS